MQVAVLKTSAYRSRYQTKFKRRQEGKTDYYARKALVQQSQNKYNTPHYRLVVRFTNTDVICQIVNARVVGDEVLAAAYSHELPKYGITGGLTNYAAAYATGLLVARRTLKKLGLDQDYQGQTEVNGEEYHVEEDGERRPFKCYLDVGIRPATTGARLFGALKGAVDGGLDIPHSTKRFPGYNKEEKSYDAEVHADRIFGRHVAEYMAAMKEEDAEKYAKQFSAYIKAGINAENMEEMYVKAHAAIRANPEHTSTLKKHEGEQKRFNPKKLTLEERRANLLQKKAALAAKAAAMLE